MTESSRRNSSANARPDRRQGSSLPYQELPSRDASPNDGHIDTNSRLQRILQEIKIPPTSDLQDAFMKEQSGQYPTSRLRGASTPSGYPRSSGLRDLSKGSAGPFAGPPRATRVPTARAPASRVPASRVPASRVPASRASTSRAPTASSGGSSSRGPDPSAEQRVHFEHVGMKSDNPNRLRDASSLASMSSSRGSFNTSSSSLPSRKLDSRSSGESVSDSDSSISKSKDWQVKVSEIDSELDTFLKGYITHQIEKIKDVDVALVNDPALISMVRQYTIQNIYVYILQNLNSSTMLEYNMAEFVKKYLELWAKHLQTLEITFRELINPDNRNIYKPQEQILLLTEFIHDIYKYQLFTNTSPDFVHKIKVFTCDILGIYSIVHTKSQSSEYMIASIRNLHISQYFQSETEIEIESIKKIPPNPRLIWGLLFMYLYYRENITVLLINTTEFIDSISKKGSQETQRNFDFNKYCEDNKDKIRDVIEYIDKNGNEDDYFSQSDKDFIKNNRDMAMLYTDNYENSSSIILQSTPPVIHSIATTHITEISTEFKNIIGILQRYSYSAIHLNKTIIRDNPILEEIYATFQDMIYNMNDTISFYNRYNIKIDDLINVKQALFFKIIENFHGKSKENTYRYHQNISELSYAMLNSDSQILNRNVDRMNRLESKLNNYNAIFDKFRNKFITDLQYIPHNRYMEHIHEYTQEDIQMSSDHTVEEADSSVRDDATAPRTGSPFQFLYDPFKSIANWGRLMFGARPLRSKAAMLSEHPASETSTRNMARTVVAGITQKAIDSANGDSVGAYAGLGRYTNQTGGYTSSLQKVKMPERFMIIMDNRPICDSKNIPLIFAFSESKDLVDNTLNPVDGLFIDTDMRRKDYDRYTFIPANEYGTNFIEMIHFYSTSTINEDIFIGGVVILELFPWFNSVCGKSWLLTKSLDVYNHTFISTILHNFISTFTSSSRILSALSNVLCNDYMDLTIFEETFPAGGGVSYDYYEVPMRDILHRWTRYLNLARGIQTTDTLIMGFMVYVKRLESYILRLNNFISNILNKEFNNTSIILNGIIQPDNSSPLLKTTVDFTEDVLKNYNNKTKRFNSAIPYFSEEKDDRVRLLIDLICTNTSDFNNVILNITHNMSVPNMDKKLFLDPMNDISSKIHYEWILFIFYISVRLQQYNKSIPDDYKKLLLALENVTTPTMHIVKGIYDKIATFTIKNDINHKYFIKNSSDIKNIDKIFFKSTIDIYNMFLATNINSYEELLYSLYYIDSTNHKAKFRLEYDDMQLYSTKDDHEYIIYSKINSINNLMLILLSAVTYDYNTKLTSNKYYIEYTNFIKNTVETSISEVIELILTTASYNIIRGELNNSGFIRSSLDDNQKILIKNSIDTYMNAVDFINIPLYDTCIEIIYEVLDLNRIHTITRRTTAQQDDENEECIELYLDIKNLLINKCSENVIPNIPHLINFFNTDLSNNDPVYIEILDCADSMGENIRLYNECITDKSKFSQAEINEALNFQYFSDIVAKYETRYKTIFAFAPLNYVPAPDFDFSDDKQHTPTEYMAYKQITIQNEDMGGIINPDDYFEADSNGKFKDTAIKTILYLGRNVKSTPSTIQVKKFTEFHFMIKNKLSTDSYNNHINFIAFIKKHKSKLPPYTDIIIDNQPCKYDVRLIDNLKVYLQRIYTYASKFTYFNYQFTKFFGQAVIEMSITTDGKTQKKIEYDRTIQLEFNKILHSKPRNAIYNKNGILMMHKPTGEVDVSSKSAGFIELIKKPEKCLGTGFNEATINENGIPIKLVCNNYIMECLKGKNIEQCKRFLKHPDFWKNIDNEVKEMYPVIMMNTLAAFGVKTLPITNKKTGQVLIYSETVTMWLKKLEEHIGTKLSKGDFEAIQSNKPLLNYMNLIIKRINENPSILNRNYKVRNIKPRPQRRFDPYNSRLFNGMRRVGFITSSNEQFGGAIGINRIPSINSTYEDTLNPSNHKKLGNILHKMYLNFTKRLKQHNKALNDEDNNTILEAIKETIDAEDKLINFMAMFYNYINYISLTQNYDHDETVSLEELESAPEVKKRMRSIRPLFPVGIIQRRMYSAANILGTRRGIAINMMEVLNKNEEKIIKDDPNFKLTKALLAETLEAQQLLEKQNETVTDKNTSWPYR